MKIISIVTGFFIVTLTILFFTGVIQFDGGINEFIIRGNQAYAANNFEQALETYQKALGENSDEPRLNYNSGQTSYQLSKYEEAIKYYDKTSNTLDKYINSGNSSFKLADSIADPTQKQQLYQQALETYKEGILAFPQNVPLKYNYEFVKNKIDEQQNNNEEQAQNKEQNKNENQQTTDEQEKNQNEQSNPDQNQQKEDSQENNQNGSSEQKDEENQKSSQDKESTGQDKEQKDEKSKEQNTSQIDESDSSNSEQNDSNIAQVLKMLEKQEQESLKNNQELQSSAKEDEYDW